ncbi:MAG: hypothetical protein GY881_12080 [Gammaproteobacteria bacterium]|nr:hypothetical protein [Gammaproteobacteria bacterium]MCP4881698.1 hypothetical protein [Gammaproteobacteria bacterium]
MQSKPHLTTQQAVAHLAKCSNHGRGRKAEKTNKQRPFQALLKQQSCVPLCSPAVLGYN